MFARKITMMLLCFSLLLAAETALSAAETRDGPEAAGGDAVQAAGSPESARDPAEVFAELLEGYPEKFLKNEVLGAGPVKDGKEYKIEIATSCNPQKLTEFNAGLIQFLDGACEEPPAKIRFKMSKTTFAGNPVVALSSSNKETFALKGAKTLSVLAMQNEDATLGMWHRYVLPKELYAVFKEKIIDGRPVLRLQLKDKSGSPVREKTFKLAAPCVFGGDAAVFYALLNTGSDLYRIEPGTESVKYDYIFDDLFPEEIAEAGEVETDIQRKK